MNYILIALLSIFIIDGVVSRQPSSDYNFEIMDRDNTSDGYQYVSYGRRLLLASDLVGGVPVYISIASISDRIKDVHATIESLVGGDVLPTHIFIIISKDPYMKDKGIPESSIPKHLIDLTNLYPVSIVYTQNTGPHRKLLPLLSHFWNTNCLLITMDDDVIYPKNTLAELIKGYILSGRDSIVALRSHRIGLCIDSKSIKVAEYKDWPLVSYGVREMLQLPTGTGGVLYRPDFFHPIVFDKRLWHLTTTGDDITFRLATMIKDIAVVTACSVSKEEAVGVSSCPNTYTIRTPGGSDRLKRSKSRMKKNKTKSKMAELFNASTMSIQREGVVWNNSILDLPPDSNDYNSTDVRRMLRAASKPRERISLWALNKHGRNDLMWNNAVKYLESTLGVSFFSIYNFYFLKERGECLSKNKAAKHKCGLKDKC